MSAGCLSIFPRLCPCCAPFPHCPEHFRCSAPGAASFPAVSKIGGSPRSGIRQRFPRPGGLSALYDFPRAAVHLRIAPAISARFRPSESIYTSGGCFSVSQIRGTFPAGWCGPAVLPAHLSPVPRICAAGCPLPDPAPVGLRCCPCTLWPFPSFLRGALFPLWLGFACMPVF